MDTLSTNIHVVQLTAAHPCYCVCSSAITVPFLKQGVLTPAAVTVTVTVTVDVKVTRHTFDFCDTTNPWLH
jgi:hypothetical protein